MEELVKVDDSGAVVSVSSGISLSDFADRWIRYLDVAPRSVQTYSSNLKQFLIWLSKNGITQPTREDIISFRDSLSVNHKPSTVQGAMAAVRLFFEFCEVSGVYKNVAKHVKSPKLDKGHKHDYLTSDQSKELLATCDETKNREQELRDRAILSVMLTTGLRTISIVSADFGDISKIGDATVLFYLGKGHTEKGGTYVKLTAPVEHAIRKYLAVRGKSGEIKENEPLFTSISNRNKNGRMTTKAIRMMVKNRLRKIGINSRRVSAHSLRHTTATLCLQSGVSLSDVQLLLDHSSISVTQIYAHSLDRINSQSEQRVSDLIFS